jgi:hypothetical protein
MVNTPNGEAPSAETNTPAPWLPSLDRARAARPSLVVGAGFLRRGVDLWTHSPAEAHPSAAVTLITRALVRHRWTNSLEMSRDVYARMPERLQETEGFVANDRRRRIGEGQPQRCSGCPRRPGFRLCTTCQGTTRRVLAQDEAWWSNDDRCPDCKDGFVRCELCDASGETLLVSVEYVNDTVSPSRRVFLPPLPEGLIEPLGDALPAVKGPAALALRLERPRLESAYRGAGKPCPPEFHGFVLGSPFEHALRAVDDLREAPGVARYEARAWVRPLLWLRYVVRAARWEVVTWIDTNGAAQTLVCEGNNPVAP